MVSAATPYVVQALRDWATANLPDEVVVNVGWLDDNQSAAQVFLIGIDDVFARTSSNGSNSEQNAMTLGTSRSRDDVGTIACAAGIERGDTDQLQALLDTYSTIVEPLGAYLRATPNLGLTVFPYLVTEVRNDRFELDSNTQSVVALVYFDIAFRARI